MTNQKFMTASIKEEILNARVTKVKKEINYKPYIASIVFISLIAIASLLTWVGAIDLY